MRSLHALCVFRPRKGHELSLSRLCLPLQASLELSVARMGEVSTPLKGDLRADGEREEPPQQGQQEESPATSAAESAEIRDASAASLGDSHGTAELYMTPVAAVPSSPSAPHPGREPPLREATEDPPSARPITMWPRPYPSPPASAGGGGCPDGGCPDGERGGITPVLMVRVSPLWAEHIDF